MRPSLSGFGIFSIGLVVLSGCPQPDPGDPIGTPCSAETLCEDLCLLDLPNGMCSMDCAEADCPEGYVCGDLSGGRYCLASCTDDAGCRDGAICVVGACRLPVGWAAACEEDGDCTEGVCHEGACNRVCRAASECPAGLSCVDVGEGPRCVEHSWPEGPGTFAESCTFADCAGGYDCMTRTEDPGDDPEAYCSRGCLTDLDCPASMSCRRTRLWGDARTELRCVPRVYCERCAYDGQCGSAGDLCVSNDPARGQGRYCSRACDPERPVSSCPTDATCREAFECGADRSWVADCAHCSDPSTCGAPSAGARHQCFEDYGACAGNGADYCSPCFVDDDCPMGGHCAYEPYFQNSFCTEPCGPEFSCPYEHLCVRVEGLDDPVCEPRTGSCSMPSGGITTCYGCDDYRDCVSGQCLPNDLARGPNVCWEDCSDGGGCPPYTECFELRGSDGTIFPLCGAQAGLTCTRVQICQEECPEGPSSCAADARDYCR